MGLNEKQEKFAQSYILHRNATERVRELENELETNVDVIEEIESQYTFARANGHTNSALKALELLSRVRGNNSELDTNLDEKSLEDGIVQCLNILGEDKVYSLLEKCDFVEDIEEEEENTTEIG
jgi:hypothetical protein